MEWELKIDNKVNLDLERELTRAVSRESQTPGEQGGRRGASPSAAVSPGTGQEPRLGVRVPGRPSAWSTRTPLHLPPPACSLRPRVISVFLETSPGTGPPRGLPRASVLPSPPRGARRARVRGSSDPLRSPPSGSLGQYAGAVYITEMA